MNKKCKSAKGGFNRRLIAVESPRRLEPVTKALVLPVHVLPTILERRVSEYTIPRRWDGQPTDRYYLLHCIE
jgi:hypothetical protein